MLSNYLNQHNIQLIETVADWEEGVIRSCELLEKQQLVPASYKENVIALVKELGPYIFLAPGIAMPHVQMFGETEKGLALLKLEKPVYYDEEHYASLFFALSASDPQSHIDMLQALAMYLSEEENITKLMNCKTIEEVIDAL